MIIPQLSVGDTVEMKKQHPCGTDRFRILRVGSDTRLVCTGCGRDLTLPRERLEKSIKKIIPAKENNHE